MIELKRKERKGAKSNNVAREPARGEGTRRKKETHLGGHCERLSLSARIKKVKGKERKRKGRKKKTEVEAIPIEARKATQFSLAEGRERGRRRKGNRSLRGRDPVRRKGFAQRESSVHSNSGSSSN